MRGVRGVALAAILAAGAGTASAAPPTTPPTTPPAPTPAVARLQGDFLLAGRVTAAANIRGEHVGQKVSRTWTFAPKCPTGACRSIGLVRRRAGGSDTLLLTRRSPGLYGGSGTFYVPLRCGSRTYSRGASVPFTITVRVSGAALAGGDALATRIDATYTNRSRSNLTPCVMLPAHDAATYHGRVVSPMSPIGGAGT